jgi:hypothetical protein
MGLRSAITASSSSMSGQTASILPAACAEAAACTRSVQHAVTVGWRKENNPIPQIIVAADTQRRRCNKKEDAEDTQDYSRMGILFQLHHCRHVCCGGTPRKERPQTHEVAVAGPATMEPRSLWPYPNTNSRQQESQFGRHM